MEIQSTNKRHRSPSSSPQPDALRQSRLKTSEMQDPSAVRHDGAAAPSPLTVQADQQEGEPSAAEVLEWLDVLQQNDTEPAEFFIERKRMQDLRARLPTYTLAATSWPRYADRQWSTVGPRVLAFFMQVGHKGKVVFVQWLLEYLSETIPGFSRANQDRRENVLRLIERLFEQPVPPLAVAASLGLTKLSEDLLKNGANLVDGGLLLPPPYCAIMGHATFVTFGQPTGTWKGLIQSRGSEAFKTPTHMVWQKIMDAGLMELVRTEMEDKRVHTFAVYCSFNFIGAMCWEDVNVFTDTLGTHWTKLWGSRMLELLVDDLMYDAYPPTSPDFLSKLLTAIFDATLNPPPSAVLGDLFDKLRKRVLEIMQQRQLSFCESQNGVTSKWTEKVYLEFLAKSFVSLDDDEAFNIISRLATDARFDPELSLGRHFPDERLGGSGTLLHVAVSADHVEVVNLLLAHEADLTARDNHGRSPLMLVESLEMLQFLVDDCSADTRLTDGSSRNIWHLLANTDELDMLIWLWDHDPHIMANLKAVNVGGRTPLASAIDYQKHMSGGKSKVAGFLLSQKLDRECFHGLQSLAHKLVEYQSPRAIRKAASVGVDFTALNGFGATVWSYMTPESSIELIKAVSRVCPPTQDIIYQISPEVALFAIIASPACGCRSGCSERRCLRPVLHAAAYDNLLTQEVLDRVDKKGRDIWERFFKIASAPRAVKAASVCVYLQVSLQIVVNRLISFKALDRHKAKHKCAGFCFLSTKDSAAYWDKQLRLWGALFKLLLVNASDEEKNLLAPKRVTGRLVFHALAAAYTDIPRQLLVVSHHVKLPIKGHSADDAVIATLQRMVIQSQKYPEILTLFFKFVTMEELEEYRLLVIDRQAKSVTSLQEQMLKKKCQSAAIELLHRTGLSINQGLHDLQSEAQGQSRPEGFLLHDNLLSSSPQDPTYACFEWLMRLGADPLYSDAQAIRAAAYRGDTVFLKQALSMVPPGWQWGQQGMDILSHTSWHQRGRTESIECLLQNSTMWQCLNLRIPGAANPVQYAVVRGYADLLKLYKQYGADLSVERLVPGLIPPHLAQYYQMYVTAEPLFGNGIGLPTDSGALQRSGVGVGYSTGQEDSDVFIYLGQTERRVPLRRIS